MKVTSGKLQIGDVFHFKNGHPPFTVEDLRINYRDIEWFLKEPTDVKKITRKPPKPQERELRRDELMQKGDMVYPESGVQYAVNMMAGHSVGSLLATGSGIVRVTRPIASARISRREYKRRVNKALEYLDQCQGSVVEDTIEILKGETQ